MTLDRLWAGWRTEYIDNVANDAPELGEEACVFCRILASDAPGNETYVVWRGEHSFAILNAYPYTSGHLLVMPLRHVGDITDLAGDEAAEVWATLRTAVSVVRDTYGPDGLNVGANLGRAAGAGVPGHFHMHVVPRWTGDTNFMSAVAEVRVLPESLSKSYEKVTKGWPR